MPSSNSARQQELITLLSDKSLGWLSDSDEKRLNTLLKEFPQVKPVDFELAAADATLTELKDLEAVDDALFQDLTMDATCLLSEEEIQSLVKDDPSGHATTDAEPEEQHETTINTLTPEPSQATAENEHAHSLTQPPLVHPEPEPESDPSDKARGDTHTRLNARVKVVTPEPDYLDDEFDDTEGQRRWLPIVVTLVAVTLIAAGMYLLYKTQFPD